MRQRASCESCASPVQCASRAGSRRPCKPTLRRRTSASFAIAAYALSGAFGSMVSAQPALNIVNAHARAFGTRKDIAVRIGAQLFKHQWSAQILRIYVDGAGSHQIAGVVLSGVKFHRPLTPALFLGEVNAIITQAFAAARVEEVDLWCVVPLSIGKGAVVSGDLAQPTERTVFSVTVRRADQRAASRATYWDARWARDALRNQSKGASPASANLPFDTPFGAQASSR